MRNTMKGRAPWAVGAAVALFVIGGAIASAPGAHAKDDAKAKTTDFSGAWSLDRKASDFGGMRGGMRGMGGGGGGMGGGGHHGGGMGGGEHHGGGMGGPPPGGGEMGGPPPDGERRGGGGMRGRMSFLRIDQTGAYVTVADSAGTTMREIALGDASKGDDGEGQPVASGKWSGHKLEVTGSMPNGRMYQETWSLSDDGKTLTIVSKTEPRDDRPAMEMKRVYRRASA